MKLNWKFLGVVATASIALMAHAAAQGDKINACFFYEYADRVLRE